MEHPRHGTSPLDTENPRHGISPWAFFTGDRSGDRGVTLPRGQDWEVRSVTLWAWRVPDPGMDRTTLWEWGQWHETQGTPDVACPVSGATGQSDTKPGITGWCWGWNWETGGLPDMPHPQPMGGRVGPGDTGCGPELTWDLRIRRSAEDRASSCSMFLSIPGKRQTSTHQEPFPLPGGQGHS